MMRRVHKLYMLPLSLLLLCWVPAATALFSPASSSGSGSGGLKGRESMVELPEHVQRKALARQDLTSFETAFLLPKSSSVSAAAAAEFEAEAEAEAVVVFHTQHNTNLQAAQQPQPQPQPQAQPHAQKRSLLANDPDPSEDATVSSYFSHHYYDILVRVGHDHKYGWQDISETGTLSGISVLDDSKYESVELDFLFPFYGHEHKTLYINPNGFISVLPLSCQDGRNLVSFCNWLRPPNSPPVYKEYIAPLMTDLNPSASPFSTVHYFQDEQGDDGDGLGREKRLIVQWSNVTLFRFSEPYAFENSFTFQAILEEDGDIIFNYLRVPFDPTETKLDINPNDPSGLPTPTLYYPLTIGIEDAAQIIDGSTAYIYPYRPLNLNYTLISHELGNSIELRALPTCLTNTNCSSCIDFSEANKDNPTGLQCGWCAEVQLCADDIGRESTDLSEACLKDLVDDMARDYETCEAIRIGFCPADDKWPKTRPGAMQAVACADGYTGFTSINCSDTGQWSEAVGHCVELDGAVLSPFAILFIVLGVLVGCAVLGLLLSQLRKTRTELADAYQQMGDAGMQSRPTERRSSQLEQSNSAYEARQSEPDVSRNSVELGEVPELGDELS